MGRKKGKQCGNFMSKAQNAVHRHTLYVEHASEAREYRNPVTRGYRNNGTSSHDASHRNHGQGDKWSTVFSSSRISSSSAGITPQNSSAIGSNNGAVIGLARLRALLEERRSEDRIHDRQLRLRIQRSRMRDATHANITSRHGVDATAGGVMDGGAAPLYRNGYGARNGSRRSCTQDKAKRSLCDRDDRHDAGWLVFLPSENDCGNQNHCQAGRIGSYNVVDSTQQCTSCSPTDISETIHSGAGNSLVGESKIVPSLQILSARALGPVLPMYVAACGHIFVGECLKSVSAPVLATISASLAAAASSSADISEREILYATDGVAKALAHSCIATGIVLRGAPLVAYENDYKHGDYDDEDSRWLSDIGFLSLCPRLLPLGSGGDFHSEGDFFDHHDDNNNKSGEDHWETLDVDLDLATRMTGCFHLKRLELIDIPLSLGMKAERGSVLFTKGTKRLKQPTHGISLASLRTLLQSCPGITHLSLSGSFNNWKELEFVPSSTSPSISLLTEETEHMNTLLCGWSNGRSTTNSMVTALRILSGLIGNNPSRAGEVGDNHGMPLHSLNESPKALSDCLFKQSNKYEKRDEIEGLDTLLPELQVLDLSNCSWVTPVMIVQFVLRCWERAYASNAYFSTDFPRNDLDNSNDWKDDKAITDNPGEDNSHYAPSNNVQTRTRLQHLNVRGCTGLLFASSLLSAPTQYGNLHQLIDEWKKHDLFHGIDLSTDRQVYQQ